MKWRITIRNIKFEMEYFVPSEIARLVLGKFVNYPNIIMVKL